MDNFKNKVDVPEWFCQFVAEQVFFIFTVTLYMLYVIRLD